MNQTSERQRLWIQRRQILYINHIDIQFNGIRLQIRWTVNWNFTLKSDKQINYANGMSTINHRFDYEKNFTQLAAFQ
jgi:hypothetical protein